MNVMPTMNWMEFQGDYVLKMEHGVRKDPSVKVYY